jgi:hypothetical protein
MQVWATDRKVWYQYFQSYMRRKAQDPPNRYNVQSGSRRINSTWP